MLTILDRCTSTGRKCDGYVTPSKNKNLALPPESRALLVPGRQLFALPDAAKARRALDFFQQRTAPQLSGYFDGSFWSGLLLQLSQSEPAVRHAMMAVSAVHEQFETSGQSTAVMQLESFALQEYNQAIGSLQRHLASHEGSVRLPLLACVLFVCLEFLRRDVDAALAHMQSGFGILRTWREKMAARQREASSLTVDDYFIDVNLVPLFSRLTVLSSLFGKHQPDIESTRPHALSSTTYAFESLDEARTSMYEMMKESLQFIIGNVEIKYRSEVDVEILLEQIRLQEQTTAWEAALEDFLARNTNFLTTRELDGARVLRVHSKTVLIWLTQALSPHQVGFDSHKADFEYIVDQCSRLMPKDGNDHAVFSFEMGVIPALYFVGIKCRDRLLRRRAISMLHATPRKEGLWDAHRAARVAERVMTLEEQGKVKYQWTLEKEKIVREEFGAQVPPVRLRIDMIPREERDLVLRDRSADSAELFTQFHCFDNLPPDEQERIHRIRDMTPDEHDRIHLFSWANDSQASVGFQFPEERSRIPDIDISLDGDNSGRRGQLIKIRTKPDGPSGDWQVWEEFVPL